MMTWQSAVAAPHAFDPRPVGGTHERNACQACGGSRTLPRFKTQWELEVWKAQELRLINDYVRIIPWSRLPHPDLVSPVVDGGCVVTELVCRLCFQRGFEP